MGNDKIVFRNLSAGRLALKPPFPFCKFMRRAEGSPPYRNKKQDYYRRNTHGYQEI
jgi:hypothetical protein